MAVVLTALMQKVEIFFPFILQKDLVIETESFLRQMGNITDPPLNMKKSYLYPNSQHIV